MNHPAEIISQREVIYQQIIRNATDSPNRDLIARMLASWMLGIGVLPDCCGLERSEFHNMVLHYFPEFEISDEAVSGSKVDVARMVERDELRSLLLSYGTGEEQEKEWITDLLVAGCLGNDHLWYDLGLWSRADLTLLMKINFPVLAEKNNRDMKWKKFLYKQLCEAEGIYVCRAPSCAVCVDYSKCFGPEN